MSKPLYQMSSFAPSTQHSRSLEDEAWEATRAQGATTQILRDKDEYLEDANRDVGRKVGAAQWEMFVVSAPGEALRMQLEHLRPEYIAIHDIGTASSRRLLVGLASAAGTAVQKLSIRRQGYGVSLATLEFVELPVPGGAPLRLYSTEADADTQGRHELARVLLSQSRLGVVMVGDLPPHALPGAFKPLQDGILAGPWPNRQLLVLPLASSSGIAAQAAQLGMGRGVQVRATPQVTRPAEAWNFISSTWNRLREQLATTGTKLPEIAGAAAAPVAAPPPSALPMVTSPMPLQPMPEVPRAGARPVAESPLAAFVQQCGEVKGMVSCCVFELTTQRPLAHAGSRPGPAALAAHGASMYASLQETAKQLGLGPAKPDAAVTLASHHLLLHSVPGHPGLALHAVLDRSVTNLTLARLQIQRLEEALGPTN